MEELIEQIVEQIAENQEAARALLEPSAEELSLAQSLGAAQQPLAKTPAAETSAEASAEASAEQPSQEASAEQPEERLLAEEVAEEVTERLPEQPQEQLSAQQLQEQPQEQLQEQLQEQPLEEQLQEKPPAETPAEPPQSHLEQQPPAEQLQEQLQEHLQEQLQELHKHHHGHRDPLAAAVRKASALLANLRRHHAAGPFLAPVDPVADGCPDYLAVVKRPVDLSLVAARLAAGAYVAADPAPCAPQDAFACAFASDVLRMLANCFAYNPPHHPVHGAGKALARFFDSQLASVFPALEVDWDAMTVDVIDPLSPPAASRKRRPGRQNSRIFDQASLSSNSASAETPINGLGLIGIDGSAQSQMATTSNLPVPAHVPNAAFADAAALTLSKPPKGRRPSKASASKSGPPSSTPSLVASPAIDPAAQHTHLQHMHPQHQKPHVTLFMPKPHSLTHAQNNHASSETGLDPVKKQKRSRTSNPKMPTSDTHPNGIESTPSDAVALPPKKSKRRKTLQSASEMVDASISFQQPNMPLPDAIHPPHTLTLFPPPDHVPRKKKDIDEQLNNLAVELQNFNAQLERLQQKKQKRFMRKEAKAKAAAEAAAAVAKAQAVMAQVKAEEEEAAAEAAALAQAQAEADRLIRLQKEKEQKEAEELEKQRKQAEAKAKAKANAEARAQAKAKAKAEAEAKAKAKAEAEAKKAAAENNIQLPLPDALSMTQPAVAVAENGAIVTTVGMVFADASVLAQSVPVGLFGAGDVPMPPNLVAPLAVPLLSGVLPGAVPLVTGDSVVPGADPSMAAALVAATAAVTTGLPPNLPGVVVPTTSSTSGAADMSDDSDDDNEYAYHDPDGIDFQYGYGTDAFDMAPTDWYNPSRKCKTSTGSNDMNGMGGSGSAMDRKKRNKMNSSREIRRPRSPRPMYDPNRTCEFCYTRETPMWRRGPSGKSTLCNKCGVKWRTGRVMTRPDGTSLPLPSAELLAKPVKSGKARAAARRAARAASAAALAAVARGEDPAEAARAAIIASGVPDLKLPRRVNAIAEQAKKDRETYEQRRHVAAVLSMGLLSPQHLAQIVALIRTSVPNLSSNDDEEIELDIEAMDPDLVAKLFDYVTRTANIRHLPNEAVQAAMAAAAASTETGGVPSMSTVDA